MSDRAYKQDEHLWFFCPGCECAHRIKVGGGNPWMWNGRLDLPTTSPSILVWCGEVAGVKQRACHSYVTDGRIQFLGDCWHELRGKTVDLPDWQEVIGA